MKRTLSGFAQAVGGTLHGDDRPFTQVVIDTRKLTAGDLFLALPGERVHGGEILAGATGLARGLTPAAHAMFESQIGRAHV